MTAAEEWNPYYLAYMYAQGECDPAHMLELDQEAWPGGKMCGFILWMRERWGDWDHQHGYGSGHIRSEEEHSEFGVWLKTTYPVICHSCGNSRCVRPDHLYAGTHQQNMLDRERHGRVPRGIQHPNWIPRDAKGSLKNNFHLGRVRENRPSGGLTEQRT